MLRWIGRGAVVIGMLVAAMAASAAVDMEYVWQVPRPYVAPDVVPVDDATYRRECSSCHFAYPPGFLPARSWRALLNGLDNHFGENAELPKGVRDTLLRYLGAQAADNSSAIGSRRLMRYMRPDETPLRLTDTRYIKLRHRNIPARIFHNSPNLKSLSNCDGCHIRADAGYFNEREVRIPGMGRWEE